MNKARLTSLLVLAALLASLLGGHRLPAAAVGPLCSA